MTRKRILIVDDFRLSNEILSNILSDLEFDIISIQNPLSVLTYIDTESIDLLITDYQMPNMNGVDLMVKIRNIPKYNKLPIIILSGINKPEVIQLAKDNNVTAWIDKPLTEEKAQALINFLNTLLK